MNLIETYDLSDLDGIIGYMEGILLSDIRMAFEKNGRLQPFGVALGTVTNGKDLPRPHPMVVGGKDARSARRTLRKMTLNSHAAGAIFAHTIDDPPAIVVQLEHKVHGDHVWTARIVKSGLREFEYSADIGAAQVPVKQTRFMVGRYAN